jgi:formylglycine-generating enzyme required for sulfatase activity
VSGGAARAGRGRRSTTSRTALGADGRSVRAALPRLVPRGARAGRSLGARLPTEAEWEHAAASGALQDTGAVWEWTASPFTGYPGFRAQPYREYSEVFFGPGHRVLRGGSWATHARVRSVTFRNWDLPGRRQLFAGVRLVR